jgi:cytochrome c oxidase subunit 6a
MVADMSGQLIAGVVVAYVYNLESEHAAHLEHLKHENGGELPEKPHYPYLHRTAKPFPWGPNSLFWNPKVRTGIPSRTG